MLKMPLEFQVMWDEARLSRAWKALSNRSEICKALRVSKEEYDRFFSVPVMDSQVRFTLTGQSSSSSSFLLLLLRLLVGLVGLLLNLTPLVFLRLLKRRWLVLIRT